MYLREICLLLVLDLLFDEDTKFLHEKYMRRLNVLPGITGLLTNK